MFSKKYTRPFIICLITLAFGAHAALASERCDTTFINTLDAPITAAKILYDTPYGEPRTSSSSIILPPGGEYRLGIQGVTLPTRIILYLPLASYEFADLSGIGPEAAMRLEVAYEDGVPRLKREDDAGKSAAGTESKFLTPENRPYAVDRDFLTDCTSMEEVHTLVVDKVAEVRTMIAENGIETVPPETILDSILFTETVEERTTLHFPVFWASADYVGYGSATPADLREPDAGIAVAVSIPLPEGKAATAADDLMSDLRVDGYRPAMFQLRATDDGDDKEVNFLEGNNDKYDDQEVVQNALEAVFAKETLVEAEILWTKEEAFDKAKEAAEDPEGPSVRVRIANGQFQAIFLP